MGQYFKPVNLDKKQYLYTHDFKSTYTRDDGTTFTIGVGLKLMEHSYIDNVVMNAVERLLIPGGNWYKNKIVWAGDYADHEEGCDMNIDLIMEREGKKIIPSTKKVDDKYKYLTNHTKKEVVDLSSIEPDEYDFKIHPLSLLVAEGNGSGGGDFHGEDKRIGTWARNEISIEDHIMENYQLVSGQFIEER